MTELATATRCIVVERVMPHPPENVQDAQSRSIEWNADHRRQADTQRRHQPTVTD